MASPSRLAAILRYMTNAVAYARQAFDTSEKIKGVVRGLAQSVGRGGGEGDLNYYSVLAITNAAFLAGTSLIAERVSGAINVFAVQEQGRDGEWVDVADHEFLALLHKPNSLMDGSTFLSELVYEKILFGNAYWVLNSARPGQGPISEILYLPAQNCAPRPDTLRRSPITGELIIDYEYNLTTFTLLPGESVVHFRSANPFDYWRGLSLLTALQNNLQINHTQGEWLADHYGEGNAIPSSVISIPPDIEDLEFEQIKRDIQNDFGGRHRTAITRAGEMDVKVIQHTIADMQILEAQQYLSQQVRRVLHVPEAFDSASSGQARLAAETALARDAVQPLLNQIAEVITNNVMYYYGAHRKYRLVAGNVVPQDRAIDATEYQVYGQDRTLNENRAAIDLPPLKLTGALAAFQALYDEIPPRYLPVLAPVLLQAAQGAGQGPNGIAGVSGAELVRQLSGASLVDGMTGRLLIDAMLGGDGQANSSNRQLLIAMMTGQKIPENSRDFIDAASYQMTGNPNQEQLINQLTGGIGMTDSEKAALLYWVHGI